MKNRWRLITGSLIFLLLAVHWAGNLWLGRRQPGSYDGWSGKRTAGGGGVITGIDPNGPARTLQIGDEILWINNVPVNDGNPYILNFNRSVPPGTHYRMTIRRNGQTLVIPLQTVPYAERGLNFDRVWMALVYLLFLLTGGFIFLLRRDDRQSKQVWLLALMLWTLTGLSGTNIISGAPDWLTALLILARIISTWFLPLFLHFFLIFPEPSPLLRRFLRLESWLYVPFYLIVLPALGLSRLPQSWLGAPLYALLRSSWLTGLARFLLVAYIFCGLISLVINYRAASQLARRRLRVILAGSGLGFLNLLLMPLGDYLGLTARFPELWSIFDTALLFTLPLVPLSFAYAIIRHQVIPVSLMIRRSVRYLLVSRGSLLLVGLGAGLLVNLLLSVIAEQGQLSVKRAGLLAALIGIVIWSLARRLHERVVAPAIDRRFFRQSYNAQQIITDLTAALRTTTSLPQLLELVAAKIQAALHTASVTIFLKDETSGEFRSAYNQQAGQPVNHSNETRLPASSHIIAALSQSDDLLELDWPPDSNAKPVWTGNGHHPSAVSSEEMQTLQTLKPSLLLPLKVKDGLVGAISLGVRLGDLPFSAEDKRLVHSVGAPTSLALENARLIEQMIAEARRREELEAENEARARELEEARQLQLSMLPKTLPKLPNLEIAAYMKTATEVGGDYYDFHLASDGMLTIAVGDATGHGLKAGTVVTAMKSLFYAHAHDPALVPVFNRSSQVLKSMNLRSLFMALTMVKLKGNEMRLASAGMPPALIFHQASDTVEEILMKSMPLGSLRNYPYREQSVILQPGDAVVLLSDGFPERFNPAGEMLGYERASEVLHEAAHLPAAQIIEHFVQLGEAWAAGRPQDDDVTFVVLKIK